MPDQPSDAPDDSAPRTRAELRAVQHDDEQSFAAQLGRIDIWSIEAPGEAPEVDAAESRDSEASGLFVSAPAPAPAPARSTTSGGIRDSATTGGGWTGDAAATSGGGIGYGATTSGGGGVTSWAEGSVVERPKRTSEHVRRTDWRLGGRTVLKWREWMLAGALISMGLGVIAGTILQYVWQSPWAAASATLLMWVGMLVPVVWALIVSRPVGLFRFRALDLLYAVALGGMLRIAQGWADVAFGGLGTLPSVTTIDGAIPASWWLLEALPSVTVAPVLEELFFRGVVLVAVYSMLRRSLGKVSAGVVAAMVSTGLFVAVHSLTLGLAAGDAIALTLLGLTCSALVLLTGRIWGAILVHLTFNGTFIGLALLGTLLG